MTTTWRVRYFRREHYFALLLLLVAAVLQLSAESEPGPQGQPAGQPPMQFEVAAIRPHRSGGDDASNRRMLPGGRFVATATSVRTLIRIAFGTDDNRISGAPGWIDGETFDIDATIVDHAEVSTPEQFQRLILSLLEERFQLKFHRAQKEGAVYWLVVDKPGKLGPALTPSTGSLPPNMSTSSNGTRATMSASQASMVDVAAGLRRQAGRPVEDHTGLGGKFDLRMEWAPEETQDSTNPSLFTAIREQLGLKLQPARGTLETFVIDSVSHPSAN